MGNILSTYRQRQTFAFIVTVLCVQALILLMWILEPRMFDMEGTRPHPYTSPLTALATLASYVLGLEILLLLLVAMFALYFKAQKFFYVVEDWVYRGKRDN